MSGKTENTLEDWIEIIANEAMFVNVKPYSHNIINVSLQAIAQKHGREAANRVIDDLDLERLGWNKESV